MNEFIFPIKITEELSRTIMVQAKTKEEALEFIENEYYSEGNIVLDASDYHLDNNIEIDDYALENWNLEEHNVDYVVEREVES